MKDSVLLGNLPEAEVDAENEEVDEVEEDEEEGKAVEFCASFFIESKSDLT